MARAPRGVAGLAAAVVTSARMLKLNVNGRSHEIADVAPDTPLLWVLRDRLNLVGTKYGCGIARCGACTVHVGGSPVRSCSVRAADVADKPITTIEGLASQDGKLHVLQEAWLELDVPQCGYCQSGQIMSAAALLQQTARPTDREIDAALAGNLCRCATYLRIRKAVHRAAEHMAARSVKP
jgi:isoquinoline 1-oxidoreductase subunit alpha